MCSNEPSVDLASRLSSVIDAVAAAADPELAERTARYRRAAR